jgi:hypothetical protein
VQSATRDATVRLPPASYCFYSPNLLEMVFSEVHLLAAVVMKPLMDEAFTSAYTPG